MDEYYVYLARVVGAARDKNRNSFSAHCGKKVAHHWRMRSVWMKIEASFITSKILAVL